MTPGAMSEAKEDPTPPPRVIPDWPCNPPPSHHFCNVSQTPGGINSPTYGLSEETMAALGITLPITSRIIVRNLAYGVNETKLREVFSLSGQMIEATLHRYDDGETKGTAAIEYAHPLGAVQAMMIFRDSKLFSRKLIIEQDKIGPQPSITGRLPDGLTDVKDGIGLNGSRLKIEYINGDAIIHHPDCHNQGSHPITEEERESHIKDGNLGGAIRLESVLDARDWPESTIAQAFADTMYDKLQHLINVSHGCAKGPLTPHVQRLIKTARDIQDEFATRITCRDSWVVHGDPDTSENSAGKNANLAPYLGTQYQIDLKKPRTRDELQILTNQIEALSLVWSNLMS